MSDQRLLTVQCCSFPSLMVLQGHLEDPLGLSIPGASLTGSFFPQGTNK